MTERTTKDAGSRRVMIVLDYENLESFASIYSIAFIGYIMAPPSSGYQAAVEKVTSYNLHY